MRLRILVTLILLFTPPLAAQPCPKGQPACEIPQGEYHVALPNSPVPDTGYPYVMFLHGAGGTSTGVLGITQMVQPFLDRGYAVIAPQGLSWRGTAGGTWSFLPAKSRPRARDEAAFFTAILADAQARHDVTPQKGLLAGFSAGGFMVSYLACETPDLFAAYAPVAGGFWRPHPTECAGPVRLLHTHGWADRTVPLEGRPLGSRFLQGDIFEGMGIWRRANGCASQAPSRVYQTEEFLRRQWKCAPDAALEMALFAGGHIVPKGWADMAMDWMAELQPMRKAAIPLE